MHRLEGVANSCGNAGFSVQNPSVWAPRTACMPVFFRRSAAKHGGQAAGGTLRRSWRHLTTVWGGGRGFVGFGGDAFRFGGPSWVRFEGMPALRPGMPPDAASTCNTPEITNYVPVSTPRAKTRASRGRACHATSTIFKSSCARTALVG
jgi:hypothetical protein